MVFFIVCVVLLPLRYRITPATIMMQPQMQAVVGPAMENFVGDDLMGKVMRNCFVMCVDVEVSREQLSKAAVPDTFHAQSAKCQKRCIGRHFEVMKLQAVARERREKEQAMGMAPFQLDNEAA